MKAYSFDEIGRYALLTFVLKKKCIFSKAKIISSSYYKLSIDGIVKDFGPERAPKGFARVKEIDLSGTADSKVVVSVLYCGFPAFDLMEQDFFFGIELYNGDAMVADFDDFECFKEESLLRKTCKYSFQRGLLERYDMTKKAIEIAQKPCKTPVFLSGLGQLCLYKQASAKLLSVEEFIGFEGIVERRYLKNEPPIGIERFDIDSLSKRLPEMGLYAYRYEFDSIKSGLFHLRIRAKEKRKRRLFILFDETLINGGLRFGRSNCSDFLEVSFDGDSLDFINAVPYSLKYAYILVDDADLDVALSLVTIQNDTPRKRISVDGLGDLKRVYLAAENSFRQNAFDLYTDCPGRERAPWLCDSLFMGFAEKELFGSRKMERNFLENFLICKEPHIPNGMLPMSFPSDHIDGTFLPEWAMFYPIELYLYTKSTGDLSLALEAKETLQSLFSYFSSYENEIGLLENLDGWVFLEWSDAIEEKRLKGVHFPTNMLYAEMLSSIGELYKDEGLLRKGECLKETIRERSYNGEYYADNMIRNDNGFELQRSNVSEIGQYLALLTGIENSDSFIGKMIREFPLGKRSDEKDMARCAPFIGGFLRLLFLLREGAKEELADEIKSYFLPMASDTNTLWEKRTKESSLNHGFTGSLTYILAKAFL